MRDRAMWRSSMNKTVSALDASIRVAAFAPYVRAIDEFCSRFFIKISDQLGPTAAKLFFLKVANLLIAKYEFTNRHITLISHPVGILVDPSNGCGLRCPGCVHSGLQRFWDWPSGLLKEETFRSFIDEHGPFACELYLAD